MREIDFKYVSQNPGIYRIVNEKNGHSFVGRTSKLKKALKTHLDNVASGRYTNVPLYDEMKADGIDEFSFEVLAEYYKYPNKEWLDNALEFNLTAYCEALKADKIDLK